VATSVKLPERVVIVGGSLAGVRAAQSLRLNGFDGQVVLIGEETHVPYDRPPLSKEVLTGSWEPEAAFLEIPGGLESLDLELRLGQGATGLDVERRRVLLEGSDTVGFDVVVIATGARPRMLRGYGEGGRTLPRGAFTLRTLDDCLAIRTALAAQPRVVVVGAGFIGSEVAASCRQRGLDVTLVEMLDVPLGNVLGVRAGAALAQLHRDHGVRVITGVGVAEIEGEDQVDAIRLTDGTRVGADVVVLGVGVAPNTEWLSASGLAIDDGVVCDSGCQTAPGVYAAGDVARWTNPRFGMSMRVEHWSNAVEQGMYLGRRIMDPSGAVTGPFESVPFFWSDQYNTKIQFVGTTLGAEQSDVVHGRLDSTEAMVVYHRSGTVVGALAMNCAPMLLRLRPAIGRVSAEQVSSYIRRAPERVRT